MMIVFFAGRLKKFQLLDDYLQSATSNILEIGCGLAVESELFQKKYDCDLYLLDGDGAENDHQQTRDIDYGEASTMQFYLTRDYLEQQWQSRGMRYEFVDAANPVIPPHIKFDFIYSPTASQVRIIAAKLCGLCTCSKKTCKLVCRRNSVWRARCNRSAVITSSPIIGALLYTQAY